MQIFSDKIQKPRNRKPRNGKPRKTRDYCMLLYLISPSLGPKALCFQQEYLRLPKNLMLTLHDLTKKWPKMTSNDLKSINYRKKTPTKI